jgi:hypothetical protein
MNLEVGFEDMVRPGMSIEAREVSRQGSSGNNLVVQYHIFVKGVPPDTLLQQVSWPVNADKLSSPLQGISVGKNGILMCAGRLAEQCGDNNNPDDPIEFTMSPIKGEPSRESHLSHQMLRSEWSSYPTQSAPRTRAVPSARFASLPGLSLLIFPVRAMRRISTCITARRLRRLTIFP